MKVRGFFANILCLHMPTAYADFHLIILRSRDHYSARVTTSPVGQATADFALPFSPEERQRFSGRAASSLRHLALVTPSTQDAAQDAQPITLQEFGTRLFDSIFAGKVGQVFMRSLDAAERNNQILRVRLQIDDLPEVAALPWEYLYSRELNRFLALSTRTPLVRYVGLAQPERPLAVTLPLRILAVVADPSDLPRLAVEQEWAHLNEALSDLVQQGQVVLQRLERATLPALRQWLRREQVHILHFIGHGDFDPSFESEANRGSLMFENDAGHHVTVTAEQLATLLHDHAALRLVYLNACHGASSGSQNAFAGVAQKLVQQGVPAVLAMQFAVSDRAAIALAHEFYQALSAGLPLESAVSEARKAIYSEGEALEWGTPLLLSRSPDGLIFELQSDIEESMQSSNVQSGSTEPWWEALAAADKGLTGDATGLDSLDTSGVSGDVIIGIVGAGASDVAVGKNITQQIYKVVGSPTPDDQQLITQAFAQLEAALSAQQSAIDAAKMQMAQSYLQLLRAELMKTQEGETPSASTITLVGNWLLDNLPQIAEALSSLFATPAVGRVIGKAGAAAVTWVRRRFA